MIASFLKVLSDILSADPLFRQLGIEVKSETRVLNQEEFHAMNHRVLGIIFYVHEFGRFMRGPSSSPSAKPYASKTVAMDLILPK